MSVPAFRNSRSRVRRRRAHHALSSTQSGTCPNCGAPVLPHNACKACGFYKGRVVNTASKKDLEKVIEKATTSQKEETK